MTIYIYKRPTAKQLAKDVKEGIEKAKAFFMANPKRRVANASGWGGTVIKVRRGHIEEDIKAAAARVRTEKRGVR